METDTQQKLTIAIIGTRGIPAHYSGLEVVVEETVKRLPSDHYRFLIYGWKGFCPPGIYGTNTNITVIPLATSNNKYIASLLYSYKATYHAVKNHVDIIHFHTLQTVFAAFFAKLCGIKTMISIHVLDWQRTDLNMVTRLFFRACRLLAGYCADRITVVSLLQKNTFPDRSRKNISVIPNGYDHLRRWYDKTVTAYDTKPFILFVGRIASAKGVDILITAFKKLADKKITLLLAGADGLDAVYTRNIKEQASEQIQFLGFVDKNTLSSLYHNALLCVIPSRSEGCPLTLMEAFSHGKCVIISAIPALQALAGESAYCVKPDAPDELAGAIQHLITDKHTRRYFEAASRTATNTFPSWGETVQHYAKIYQTLYYFA